MTPHIFTINVSTDWIDYNQHMNAGYYNVVFDKAAEAMLADLGAIPYMEATGGTFYSVETHIVYKQELKVGAPLRVETLIAGLDRKRVHVYSTIFEADKGYAAATGETMMLHFNQREQQVTAMPDDFYAGFEKMAQEHAQLPSPADLARAIRPVRK